jgi:acetyl-CoA carboxylase carboxyltransferase component
MVTALIRLNGRPAGVIANQPHHLGGAIDSSASEKAAGFISRCDAFGLPLVVLVDTPGFLPGTRQEAMGVIRHGAGVLHAFSAARVPKVTVVLRKAYGGGFITMNSRKLGADLVFAWPSAEIGVLGARQAVGIVHGRAIEAAADPERERERLAGQYADQQLTAEVAAGAGDVDEVIEPGETRNRLIWAFSTLGGPNGRRRTG